CLVVAAPPDPVTLPDEASLGVHTPVRSVHLWDARTGRHLTGCDQLLPDPELVKQGWRHRYLSTFVTFLVNHAGTRVVTQLLRAVRATDGKPAGVEARAQVHDLATGKTVRSLDPRPGVIEYASFSPDDKYILTRHRTGKPGDKSPADLVVWEADTGRK